MYEKSFSYLMTNRQHTAKFYTQNAQSFCLSTIYIIYNYPKDTRNKDSMFEKKLCQSTTNQQSLYEQIFAFSKHFK